MNGIFNTSNTNYPNEMTEYEQHQGNPSHQNEQFQLNDFNDGTEPKTKLLKHISSTNTEPIKSVKHYDGTTVGQQFIDYFYSSWCNNIDLLSSEEIIKLYSKLRYNSITYEGINFIEILRMFTMSGLTFSDCRYEILDSGSRQVYMLVTGIMIIEQVPKTFSQTFMIAYTGENIKKGPRKWTLMNSLLILN